MRGEVRTDVLLQTSGKLQAYVTSLSRPPSANEFGMTIIWEKLFVRQCINRILLGSFERRVNGTCKRADNGDPSGTQQP